MAGATQEKHMKGRGKSSDNHLNTKLHQPVSCQMSAELVKVLRSCKKNGENGWRSSSVVCRHARLGWAAVVHTKKDEKPLSHTGSWIVHSATDSLLCVCIHMFECVCVQF